jgi:phenylpyruvate tautomerase PptA (4-oxalocrotonate tautomerase family)
MPVTKIELSKPWPNSEKKRLAAFVHETMVEVLNIPEYDRLIRIVEHEPENFYAPKNGSDNYVLVEITLFPGRKLDTKRELYKRLCEGMKTFGVDSNDTRVVLYEVLMENWGIRGGQAGSDVVLGFQTDV